MKYLYSDFVLLIFNCEKYREKALKQKETWLNNFTLMPYFHVIGNPKLTTNYTFDFENKVLYVKVEDDYNSLPKKAIVAYEAIQNTYIFKYIFKTDDDQNLTNIAFLNTIQNILLNNTKKIHYAGHIIDVDTPYVSQYCKIHPELPENLVILQTRYCSGRFYVLSELSVQSLISKKEAINKEYLEDYAIGLNLDPFLKENMLNIQTDKYFVDFLNF
jgi:hypothetical protein